MRHRLAHRKLGRSTEHRLSLLRNLAVSLIQHERIRTTLAKAKELRPFAEKLVTLGKRDSLHARRRALSIIPRQDAVRKLFSDISPRFSERPGGYTRILKIGPREGDGASMAYIEFVDYVFKGGEAAAPAARSEKPKKERKKAEAAEEEADAVEASAAEVDDDEGVKASPRKKSAKKKSSKKKTSASKKKSAKKASAKKKTTKKKASKKKKKT